jgi:hypothetical protein
MRRRRIDANSANYKIIRCDAIDRRLFSDETEISDNREERFSIEMQKWGWWERAQTSTDVMGGGRHCQKGCIWCLSFKYSMQYDSALLQFSPTPAASCACHCMRRDFSSFTAEGSFFMPSVVTILARSIIYSFFFLYCGRRFFTPSCLINI